METITIRRFPALSYACAEAINTLCANLSFAGENVRRIMVTSCHAAEGKSFLEYVYLKFSRPAKPFTTPFAFTLENAFTIVLIKG